jgi:hypothetical protein
MSDEATYVVECARESSNAHSMTAVEVRGVEPRSVKPSALASPSAVVSELRSQEL